MAKVLMIQGTMSNAGKSLITAALCRIFKQDGYRVAPFKSQNMALNSYITKDGNEMGRAQAVQAMACGLEPTVLMNPILLKPTTDMGSQVIVQGHSIGNMHATEYFSMKKSLVPYIMEAFEELSKNNDIIVVEGAGSPAEINLKSDDIVNMGLAKMLDAKVLLVGDIDRGGVFAQLYGTMELLEEDERNRIYGMVINKFRGDRGILEPGITMIEEKCHCPVVGVIPYVQVDIEDEDSLSGRLMYSTPLGNDSVNKSAYESVAESGKRVDQAVSRNILNIAVIRLPRISNFTDFGPLEAYQGVNVFYSTNPRDLEKSDMVIVPGTKSTMDDLHWLKTSGFGVALARFAQKGGLVLGICGGYQMLGKEIHDPYGMEGEEYAEGLGLLDVSTVFSKEKATFQREGRILNFEGAQGDLLGQWCAGLAVKGYEIHMGRTTRGSKAMPWIQLKAFNKKGENQDNKQEDNQEEGSFQQNVYGTYLHGIFENVEFTQRILEGLCLRKGISPQQLEKVDYEEYRESQFDLLAKSVRDNIDLDKIYQFMELK